MTFTPTGLPGAFVVDLERHEDERGFFARTWCAREFEAQGLSPTLAQCSVSRNVARGTLRGLHYQQAPHGEAKLVRCTRGAIFDVIVDLRPESTTYLRHYSAVLSDDNQRALYIPVGFAHGFQTLADDSEVFYQMDAAFVPEAARGLRWNDPLLGIAWPLPVSVIAERDRSYPDIQPARQPEVTR